MELLFVRHGQGEHNLNVPDRLSNENPHLTTKGKAQVQRLTSIFDFYQDDVFIVSPTIRTIETARILTEYIDSPKIYLSPWAGPRVFPLNNDSKTAKCDIHLPLGRVLSEYTDYIVLEKKDSAIWNEGINIINDPRFFEGGEKLIHWMKNLDVERVVMISHDGAITNYRKLLGEQGLERSDFLGEAGTYKIEL